MIIRAMATCAETIKKGFAAEAAIRIAALKRATAVVFASPLSPEERNTDSRINFSTIL